MRSSLFLVLVLLSLSPEARASQKVLVAKQVSSVRVRPAPGKLRSDIDDLTVNRSVLHKQLRKVEISYTIHHGAEASHGRVDQQTIDALTALEPGERLVVGQGKHSGFDYSFALVADGLGRSRPEYHVAAWKTGLAIGGQEQVSVREIRTRAGGEREMVTHWWSGSGADKQRKTVLIPLHGDTVERTFHVGGTKNGPVLVTIKGDELTGLIAPGWRQKVEKD